MKKVESIILWLDLLLETICPKSGAFEESEQQLNECKQLAAADTPSAAIFLLGNRK